MNAAVLETIKKSAAVPSMPQVVARFLEIMRDPEFDYDDLVKAMSADPGTVSELLRLCNSALFGLRQKVVSTKQALTLLGPRRVRSLLLGRYLMDAMSRQDVPGLDMCYFWRRSVVSSVVASRLAQAVAPSLRDEAFLGALLAKIGVPILAQVMPERYGSIAARFAPREKPIKPEQEQQAVRVTHAEVSAMVLAHWSLPELIWKAVNLHQAKAFGEDETSQVARLLNASDRLAMLLCDPHDAGAGDSICTQALEIAGLGPEAFLEMLPPLEAEVEEMAGVLRIDVIPPKAYALLARIVREQLADAPSP